MAKVQIKDDNITAFGGIFHIMDIFKRSGMHECIDKRLGQRGKLGNAYQYSDIFLATFCSYLCGGNCLEDIMGLCSTLSSLPNTRIPSSDTIARGMKELHEENLKYTNKKEKTFDFNKAEKLNRLLLELLQLCGQIRKGDVVDVDFDHEFTPTEKFDAKFSYKKKRGYFPGIASVGKMIIGIENRDANTNVKFNQADTLDRIFTRLKDVAGVEVDRFRADCGSYSKDIIEKVMEHCKRFYIRASNCQHRYHEFYKEENWRDVEINYEKYGVISTTNDTLIKGTSLRLVVQRQEMKDKEGKVVTDLFGKRYVYRCIITNDWDLSEEDVIRYYNQRGESERNFDVQNNDFGWAHQPFSDMKDNTVFLLITAMLKNFYLYVLNGITPYVKSLNKNSRLKNFIFHFINVPAKWIKSGRRYILNLYTRRTYYQNIFVE